MALGYPVHDANTLVEKVTGAYLSVGAGHKRALALLLFVLSSSSLGATRLLELRDLNEVFVEPSQRRCRTSRSGRPLFRGQRSTGYRCRSKGAWSTSGAHRVHAELHLQRSRSSRLRKANASAFCDCEGETSATVTDLNRVSVVASLRPKSSSKGSLPLLFGCAVDAREPATLPFQYGCTSLVV